MPTIERKLMVCDYCYQQHEEYLGENENFDYTNKQQITNCTSCGSSMCLQCHEASMLEIN